MTSLLPAVAQITSHGHALDVTFAVVAGIILLIVVVAALRRRRNRREFGGGRRWWRGEYASPDDEPLTYQRRDDSGQGR